MLLELFDWLSGFYGGFRVFGYLTLRAILAALTALLPYQQTRTRSPPSTCARS